MKKRPLFLLLSTVLALGACSRNDDPPSPPPSSPNVKLTEQVDRQQKAIANAAAQRRKEAERNSPSTPAPSPSAQP